MSTDRPCGSCGAVGPIHSRRTGIDLCRRCYSYPERACGRCGREATIKKRATDSNPDLCERCYGGPEAVCVTCGKAGICRGLRQGEPICERCILKGKIRLLVTGPAGQVPAWAEPIEQSLLSTKHPQTMFVWLRRSYAARVLRDLVSGMLPLTHEALDGLGPNKAVAHLRDLLIASGALPWRNPHIARFESRAESALHSLHVEDRRFVGAFLRWRILRRLRSGTASGTLTSSSVENALRMLHQVTRFLTWLRTNEIPVRACSQTDIDRWLSEGKLTRLLIRDFVMWMAKRGHMTELFVPALAGSRQPTNSVDDTARWRTAKRLLHDDSLDVADRVAGALVLLYAQPVSRIALLTPKHVIRTEDSLLMTLGREPVEIPEPLARLVRQLPQRRRRGSSAHLSDPDQWLFPGGRAGHPISRSHLSKRLRDIGIDIREARNAALLQLAGEVPPVVLADLLGISINNAVKWVGIASGDWSNYAADRATAPFGPAST
ncbi:MAG: hypothetical protein ACRDLB_12700 [Actinomycetota bacterium]